MNYEQELEDRAMSYGQDGEEEECDECFHPIRLHGKHGCEVERDRYESGYAPMAVPCGCQACKATEVQP